MSTFEWSPVTDGVMRLTSVQTAALLHGMNWPPRHGRELCGRSSHAGWMEAPRESPYGRLQAQFIPISQKIVIAEAIRTGSRRHSLSTLFLDVSVQRTT
jgi:hypothetical protein